MVLASAPTPTSESLKPFGFVDETAHVGTSFPSDSVQLSAWLTAENSDELIRDLATLVSHRGVVFFKNQDLTIQQQKQLMLRFGELTGRPKESSLHKHPISETTPELGADTSVISSMGCVTFLNVLYTLIYTMLYQRYFSCWIRTSSSRKPWVARRYHFRTRTLGLCGILSLVIGVFTLSNAVHQILKMHTLPQGTYIYRGGSLSHLHLRSSGR